MQDTYIEINSVPTHLYTWGFNFEEKLKNEKNDKLVLVITGNPGLPGFYTTFGSSLYESLNEEIPICVIGHAGHDEPPSSELNMKVPKLKTHPHLYDLNGQIKHKGEFIDLIPEFKEIYVIGHSVGAKIILELLKSSSKFDERVVKCYLMFPTIEYIAKSSHGRIFTKLTSFFFIARIILVLFNYLPLGARKRIVKFYCRDMPEEFHEHALEHTKTEVVEKIFYMAKDEMHKINEYDEELIKNNLHRIKLYYGASDGWVRKRFYYGIVDKFPEIEAELCSKNYEHAFVLKNGRECGAMVAEWIKEHLSKNKEKI